MEKKVGDIMVPIVEFATVPAESTVKDAVAALKACRGYPLVLVLENDRAAGMVGLKEVLRGLDPVMFKKATYGGWTINPGWREPVLFTGHIQERCAALAERPVKEIMIPLPRQLRARDGIVKAAHIILSTGQEPVPVWQEDRLVGMVGMKEIFAEMVRELDRTRGGSRSKVIFADQFRRKAGVVTKNYP
ncbi:CBS domain containing-hemolysin-like protein [Desulfofundulus luciae]|uniref:CBS domain containing-hemolysin-like protein n=1 Tax=Desulfofundulus luciae TaxID=74702 RepID=A0ABU0AY85_9FIRM|nr:CBS domain-containing protein [Desulfofundulus luciae]MDQ0284994.1 CBS domain containing-hemolysin-like protein [Desulfofundulus luciae]